MHINKGVKEILASITQTNSTWRIALELEKLNLSES